MYLLFGVHNHQPVGNFEEIFKKASNNCYYPFIETLFKYPEIKATMHISGSLIDWLLQNNPGFLEKLKEMVKRRQVELLTGAYHEPILPIIPERDRLGQIKMLTDFIKDYFDFQPQGMWVGERVWEPQLVRTLIKAGVKYILLDDFHFLRSGVKKEDLLGYYITEEEGATLAAFPISKKLRYIIPFSAPTQPINYLKSIAGEEKTRVVTIVDDGEKFGLWPGTYQWVWREKWLERFFQALIANQDWLQTQTISEYMQKHKAQGLCCLACASYEEMMSWSGGFFRNFLVKYPEVNNLHKRMLYVSEKVNKQKSENEEAKRYLYMAQCNCPYWHGVFGGIYLKHLRSNAYKNLITAQILAENKEKSGRIETEVFDFDRDGQEELIVKSALLNVFISPAQGGAIFELDYLPKAVNLVDVMSRRPEEYHDKIKSRVKKMFGLKKKKIKSIHDLLSSKEKGLENFLIYDSYRRLSLIDHFFMSNLNLKTLRSGQYAERGDFVNGQYLVSEERKGHLLSIVLRRDGTVYHKGTRIPLTLTKRLSLNNKDPKIDIEYILEPFTKKAQNIIFAPEFNISCSGQKGPNVLRLKGASGQKDYPLTEDVIGKEVKELCLEDVHNGIEIILHFENRPHLWSYPLETISASEEGFERNYQQTVVLPLWPIKLEKAWETKIALKICNLGGN